METYYVDGAWLPEDQASLSIKDIAILRGYGVFDFLRTYRRRPFHLEAHIARLEESARQIGLELRWSAAQIAAAVMQTLARNPHLEEANIRIVVTGGVSADGVLPEGRCKLLILVTPKHDLPPEWYRQGVKVITLPERRAMPGAKSTNYLRAVMAQVQGRREGAVEAIYTDAEGCLLEGTTANLFALRDGRLVTAGEGRVLPGITRQVVLRLLQGVYPVDLRAIRREELPLLDELFLTASNKEIVPVVRVDAQTIGEGRPGPATLRIMERFRGYTQRYGQGLED